MKHPILRRHRWVFSVLLLLAFGLRVLDLTQRSLWFDEAVEYLTAQPSFSQVLSNVVALNYQPPLFAYVLHLWLRISIQPLWLRLLPVCLSLLTVAVMIRWSYERSGYRGAVFAGLIIALMPSEIYYAQDVGEYALLFLLLASSLYFLDKARTTPSLSNWFSWAIVSVAAMYTHYGAAVIVAAAAAVTMIESLWRRRRAAWQRQLLVGSGLIVAVFPLLLFFLPKQIERGGSGGEWTTYSFPGWVAMFSQLGTLLHKTFLYNFSGWPISEVPTLPATFVLIMLTVLLLLAIRRLPTHWLIWSGVAFALYFILVELDLYAGGMRYGLIFTPLLVVLIAHTLDTLWERRKLLAIFPFMVLVGVEIFGLPNATLSQSIRAQPSWQPREQMAQTFAYWQAQRQPGDKTFVYYAAVPAFHYYLQASNLNNEEQASKQPERCDTQETYAVCRENGLFYSPWARHLSPEEKIAAMYEMLETPPERLWLIFSHVTSGEDSQMLEGLSPAYQIVKSNREGLEGAVLLLRRE